MPAKKGTKKTSKAKLSKAPAKKKSVKKKASSKTSSKKNVGKKAGGSPKKKAVSKKQKKKSAKAPAVDVGGEDSLLAAIRAAHRLFLEQNYGEAIESCERILGTNPECSECIHIIGLCSFMLGDQGRALTLLEHAHNISPECRDYTDALSYVYTYVGKLTDGLYYAKLSETLEAHPDIRGLTPDYLADYGGALKKGGDPAHFLRAKKAFLSREYENAVASADKELRLNRGNSDAYHLLGLSLLEMGEYSRAVSAFHAEAHLNLSSGVGHSYLALALIALGRNAEARAVLKEALSENRDSLEVWMCAFHALALMGETAIDDDAEASILEEFNSLLVARHEEPRHSVRQGQKGQKIRIGYISDSFYAGKQAPLMEPLFRYANKNAFDIYCYSLNPSKDMVSSRFKNYVTSWRDVFDFDGNVLGDIIRGDEIDILVDLCSGFISQPTEVFFMGAAPIQMSLFGRGDFPALPGITDYLTDAVMAKSDEGLSLPGQVGHVLEGGLLSIDQPNIHETFETLPFEKNGVVTLGGTCDLSVLTADVVSLWSRILKRHPYSQLRLGGVPRQIQDVKLRILEMFAHFGVMEKISFQELPENNSASMSLDDLHLGFLREIDVYLDVKSEDSVAMVPLSLWMGVPVISLPGRCRSGMYGASALNAAGKRNWVADDEDSYIEMVGTIISDPDKLSKIRQTLSDETSESSLFMPAQKVRDIEAFFKKMHARLNNK